MTRKAAKSSKTTKKSKLGVRKETLKDLGVSDAAAAGLKGGLMAYTKHSVCADQCCATDANAQCR